MTSKKFLLLSFLLLCHCTPRCSRDKKATEIPAKFDGKVYFEFTRLPEGVIAQSGPHQVLRSEITKAAPYRSFMKKKNDLTFALIYKQFIAYNKKKIATLELSTKKLSRSPESILTQYGIPIRHETKIKLGALKPEVGLAQIDGRLIKEADLDKKMFLWAQYETELFRYQLNEIDKRIKAKVLSTEAMKLGLSTEGYTQKYVFDELQKDVSHKEVSDYMAQFNMDDNDRVRALAKNRILELRKNRGINYVLERYVMDLPVQVSLNKPSFKLENKESWTPTLGNPNGILEITVFSETQTPQSEKLLRGLAELVNTYKDLKVILRPFALKGDLNQTLVNSYYFCAWSLKNGNFIDYLVATIGDHADKVKDVMAQKAKASGYDSKALNQCVDSGQVKEISDYHTKYAEYLGIVSSPVLFIEGEVLSGVVLKEDVEKIIHRELKIPSAGVW